ncbi:unnamed protein product, partial [Trichobilharzia regenti]
MQPCVNNNSASKCKNSNQSVEMLANPTVLSNEQPSTNIIASITTKPDVEMVIDSMQPQKLSKMDTNTSLENISSSSSPVNFLPQTTDQSDEYIMKSLVSPVPPIKRKRGRPRKYASSGQVHHPSLQHSRHMHHFTSLGSTGRYSYVTSQYYTRSSSTIPMSTVSLTPALSPLCSNMNMTVNSHQSIVDCQNVNSLLTHNLETNNNNNSKNTDVFRSATCSSEPSPSDSILTNACVSSSMNYMEIDRMKPSGYEIIGQSSSSSIFPVMNDSTVGCSPGNAKLTQEITPVDLYSNPSPRLRVINSSPGMNGNPSNNNNNSKHFLPSQSMMTMETSNPAWYPDAAINNRSFIPQICHNPLLSSPFYIDPNRSTCFLPIFEASASSSNYMNTPGNSFNSPSVRDVDLIM